MEVFNSVNERLLSQTKPSVLLDKIEFKLNENENNLNDHKLLKQQYHFLRPDPKLQQSDRNQNGVQASPHKLNGINGNNKQTNGKNDGIPSPKHVICPPNAIQLEWKQSRSIGAGCMNLGNTCFMNSVLQALTYCPPLVNFLLHSNNDHQNKCKVLGLCMTCELSKHMRSAFQNSGGTIRPQSIFARLKSLAKSFQPGRQEDSHEFLRYVIDNIWKSCCINWEQSHGIKLDSQSKETTFINQIFGGYHRSQITCLTCQAESDTYDYFMDFILDIKTQTVSSLEKALEQFTKAETLQNENAYKCSNCKKKVEARKKFTVHRAPNVATFQLKRFDYNRIFSTKITKNISYPEILNLRPYMSENKGEPINYKLFAVLVHLGSTANSGHYFCYVRNSNNQWYLMDDARVTSASLSQVLDQQAYMLFYVRIPNKQFINRNDSFKGSLANLSSDKMYSIINTSSSHSKDNGLNGKIVTNHNYSKPNGLIHKEIEVSANKKPNNLPRIISDNVNSLKSKTTNGESTNKFVNSNGPTSNRLSILADIDSRVNLNLNKSTSLLKPVSTTQSPSGNNAKKPEEKKSLSTSVKRLVPYDNNSSSDESDTASGGKSLLLNKETSNGVKKLKSGDSREKCNGSSVTNGKNSQKKDESSDDDDKCTNEELIKSVTKHLEGHIQSDSEKNKKQLINGFAKFAESLGYLCGENDVIKHIESFQKDKIEIPPSFKQKQQSNKTPPKSSSAKSNSSQKVANQQETTNRDSKNDENQSAETSINTLQLQATPIKGQFVVTRTISPAKMNGHLSNNYYQSKQANLRNNNWIVDESPSKAGKTSSIASGSSTNSIHSTTEWQVIDSDSSSLKKHLHRRVDNLWEVADVNHKSRSPSGNEQSDEDDGNNNSDSEDRSSSKHKKRKDRSLSEFERCFEKKLRKIEKKDKKKFQELYSDPAALKSLYEKMKRKYLKKRCKSDDEERRHKKRHKREHSSGREDSPAFRYNHSSQESKAKDESSQPSSNNHSKVISSQKNVNHHFATQQFNRMFGNNNKKDKDVKSELNDMHLNLLGKNVNTWDGKKTQVDREVKEDLERNKKKSKDDLYNEEYDKGKGKKVRLKSDDDNERAEMKQNPFQRFYNEQYMKNTAETNKIKSL